MRRDKKMKKIALMTDSASDFPKELARKYNIKMLYFDIIYKDSTYKDQLEISSKEVLATIDEKEPTTSLPSLEQMHQRFQELKEEGYEEVIAITMSTGLSGCYNALCMVAKEYPEIKSYIYDSKTLSICELSLVELAAEMIEKGHSVEEIATALEKRRAKQHTFFIVGTLKYLIRGGRIGYVSGTIGELLNLKPVITIGEDGFYHTYKKVRGKSKALNVFIEETKKLLMQTKCKIYMIHGDGEEDMETIYDKLKGEANLSMIKKFDWISPVACVHAGPGFLAILVEEID